MTTERGSHSWKCAERWGGEAPESQRVGAFGHLRLMALLSAVRNVRRYDLADLAIQSLSGPTRLCWKEEQDERAESSSRWTPRSSRLVSSRSCGLRDGGISFFPTARRRLLDRPGSREH